MEAKGIVELKRQKAVQSLQVALQYAHDSALKMKEENDELEQAKTQQETILQTQIAKSLKTGEKLIYDLEVDIVYASAYSIKKYFLESGNPRQMRGASQLLNEIFMGHIPKLVEEKYISKCVYFQGGSQIFLILPKGEGRQMAVMIEECIANCSITAQGAAVSECVEAGDLLNNTCFTAVMNKAIDHLQNRRMLKYGNLAWMDQDGHENAKRLEDLILEENLLPHEKEKRDRIYVKKHDCSDMRCSRCRLRRPHYLGRTEGEGDFELCRSCTHKEVAGSYISRNSFRAQCAEFCETDPECAGIKLVVDNCIHTTDDLKDRNGDIALLYADINNLGGIGQQLNGIIERRMFYEAIKDTVSNSLYKAIIRTMKILQKYNIEENTNYEIAGNNDTKKNELIAKFEIIAAGGDDVCVLLPGEGALYMASEFTQEFEQNWKSQYAEIFPAIKSNLSISAGISVAKYNTPIAFMHETTEQLLESAKSKAHKLLREKAKMQGAIDILYLNSDGQWAVELDYLRKRKSSENPLYKDNALLTMRPFSITEAKKFLQILQTAEVLPNHLLRTIDTACKNCDVDEGKLFFDYLLAKMSDSDKAPNGKSKKENLRHLLLQISEMLKERIKMEQSKDKNAASKMGMYFELEGEKTRSSEKQREEKKWIAPWHDIVDLRNQKGGADGYKSH